MIAYGRTFCRSQLDKYFTIVLQSSYPLSELKFHINRAVFALLKSFFNFFVNLVSKSHLPFPIWCGKRDKCFSCHNGKGGEIDETV